MVQDVARHEVPLSCSSPRGLKLSTPHSQDVWLAGDFATGTDEERSAGMEVSESFPPTSCT